MSYTVTRDDILNIEAEAAVVCVEISLTASDAPSCRRLSEAGGEELASAIRRQGFLPVGSCAAVEIPALPYRQILLCAAPRWCAGKSNELLILHRCYQNLFALCEERGLRSVVTPFLSADYYRYPRDEAVRIALVEAGNTDLQVTFTADTEELLALSRTKFRKPEIVSYIGWYRDHAIFELDDGHYVRVDLRPEKRDVAPIPYFEACFRTGNNPLQEPLPPAEIARLKQIYRETDW